MNAPVAPLSALLCGVADGDLDDFAALYDATRARLHGVAWAVLGDGSLAEDTTQEVYLQVWRTAARFDPSMGSAMSWLTTLAHRRAVDRVRSEQAHRTRSATYDNAQRLDDFDHVVEEVLNRNERQIVRQGLATLTDAQCQSITLAYYGGLTYREVANYLGVALPTVKSRIRSGLLDLRQSMSMNDEAP